MVNATLECMKLAYLIVATTCPQSFPIDAQESRASVILRQCQGVVGGVGGVNVEAEAPLVASWANAVAMRVCYPEARQAP